mmetsp:Transcript_54245/g.100266  ORF Transcript_54245/g.100266 Transcript_54245/m.100266 type:complete len:221 (-) Transcript_54245:392-1054(-)
MPDHLQSVLQLLHLRLQLARFLLCLGQHLGTHLMSSAVLQHALVIARMAYSTRGMQARLHSLLVLLVHLLYELLVHMRSTREFVLKVLVDMEVSSQLRIIFKEYPVLVQQSLCLLALKVQLCRHLLILHDGALRGRVELILCSSLQHLSGLLDAALHVILELIDLNRFLTFICTQNIRMAVCLVIKLLLQALKLSLHAFLVPFELFNFIQCGCEMFVLHL